MEWNAKPPLQWDWDSLFMFDAASNESPKKLQPTVWDFDGEGEIESGSIYSSGGGDGSGFSGSVLGLASFSKSLKSASFDSSPIVEVKTSKITLEANQGTQEEFTTKEFSLAKPTGSSPVLKASVGSGEPFLSLKLGKQTYFEDSCAGSNIKTSSLSVIPVSSVAMAKRSQSSFQNTQVPRCQVEGCNLDLTSAKDYHRKHRVCISHSKSPKVIVNGLERRFCQQCSRFHGLTEFDEKKRSCRRRLTNHNARRRKPQPESVHFNAARLPSFLYDEKHQMSLTWSRSPLGNTKPDTSFAWGGTCSNKLRKDYVSKLIKAGDIDGQLHLSTNEMANRITLSHHDSNGFLPPKSNDAIADVLNQGIEEPRISSNAADGRQDLRQALSLLSSDAWGSCQPKSSSFELPMHVHPASMPQTAMHVITQGMPLSPPECWRSEQHLSISGVQSLASGDGSNFTEGFQLHGSGFYSNQLT